MKIFFLLSLLIVSTFQVTTDKYLTCVSNIDRSNCDSDCNLKLESCRYADGDV